MFKRAVRAGVASGHLATSTVAEATDDALTERLFAADPTGLARAVHGRRLFKRALDLPASDVPAEGEPWTRTDPDLLEKVEDRLAEECGLGRGELLFDFPSNPSMLAVDLPLRTRTGAFERLTGQGRAGQFGLPRVAEELYESARRLRIFTSRPVSVDLTPGRELIGLTASQLETRLSESRRLL